MVALALAVIYIDPFVGDWDGLDYTIYALNGRPSSGALGRSAFVFTNHLLWRVAHAVFQLEAKDAYLLFKGAVLLQCGLGVIACWVLAREVTGSKRTATVASLAVALSPAYVLYGGQVMTEIPSLLVLAIALTIYLRGVRENRLWLILAGAGLLGVDVNMRETIAFFAPWLIIAPLTCGWKIGRREIVIVASAVVLFLLFATVPFAAWYWSDVGGYRASWFGWLETTRVEAARHPISIRNAPAFFVFFAVTAPLVFFSLPFAFYKEWRLNRFSPLFGLGIVGLFANLFLFLNYSMTINWRYFLTGLPGLAPLAAFFLMLAFTKALGNERRALVACIAGLAIVAILTGVALTPLRAKFAEEHALMKNYRARLVMLPEDAVVMAGRQTVAVTFWRGVGEGHWDVIGTGSMWPGTGLVSLIDSYLKNGRRVFLDTDARVWTPCTWQRDEIAELVKIESQFRFGRVTETIFEIRPRTDATTSDSPQLRNLLPENRPDDIRACGGINRLN